MGARERERLGPVLYTSGRWEMLPDWLNWKTAWCNMSHDWWQPLQGSRSCKVSPYYWFSFSLLSQLLLLFVLFLYSFVVFLSVCLFVSSLFPSSFGLLPVHLSLCLSVDPALFCLSACVPLWSEMKCLVRLCKVWLMLVHVHIQIYLLWWWYFICSAWCACSYMYYVPIYSIALNIAWFSYGTRVNFCSKWMACMLDYRRGGQ